MRCSVFNLSVALMATSLITMMVHPATSFVVGGSSFPSPFSSSLTDSSLASECRQWQCQSLIHRSLTVGNRKETYLGSSTAPDASSSSASLSTDGAAAAAPIDDPLMNPSYEIEPLQIRMGHGFDIHRMAPIEEAKQPVVIGGVTITHSDQNVRTYMFAIASFFPYFCVRVWAETSYLCADDFMFERKNDRLHTNTQRIL